MQRKWCRDTREVKKIVSKNESSFAKHLKRNLEENCGLFKSNMTVSGVTQRSCSFLREEEEVMKLGDVEGGNISKCTLYFLSKALLIWEKSLPLIRVNIAI